eukprot:m.51669 g.51669  ORF g.51669 m.51669 type:complete len:499 (-) comp21483_c0_seq1:369-1865(-)
MLRTGAIQLRRAAALRLDNQLPLRDFSTDTSTSSQIWNKYSLLDLKTSGVGLSSLSTLIGGPAFGQIVGKVCVQEVQKNTQKKSASSTLRRSQSDPELNLLEETWHQTLRVKTAAASIQSATSSALVSSSHSSPSVFVSSTTTTESGLHTLLRMLPVAVVVESKLHRCKSESELTRLGETESNSSNISNSTTTTNNTTANTHSNANYSTSSKHPTSSIHSTHSTSSSASSSISNNAPLSDESISSCSTSSTATSTVGGDRNNKTPQPSSRHDAMLLSQCTSLCQVLLEANELRETQANTKFNEGLLHHQAGDLDLALEAYCLAADRGNDKAMVNAASLLLSGPDATVSATAALRATALLETACVQHNVRALTMVGTALCFGSNTLLLHRDELRGAKMLRDAAAQGSVEAMLQLSRCLAKGTGFRRNSAEAMKWCSKAAARGAVRAQFALACWYHTGEMGGQNLNLATHWYKLAADQRHKGALKNLKLLQRKNSSSKTC